MRRRFIPSINRGGVLFLTHLNQDFKDEITGELMQAVGENDYPVFNPNGRFGGCVTGTAGSVIGSLSTGRRPDIMWRGAVTIELWFKTTAAMWNSSVRVCCNNDMYCQIGINVNYSGKIMILNSLINSTWENTALACDTPIDGKWHHIALSCNNNVCKLFIDGSMKHSTTRNIITPISVPGYTTAIMCEENDFIDEVRISDFARYEEDFTPANRPF